MNSLTRDGILIRALDMIDSPTLDQKERPASTITGTLAVGWLEDALRESYNLYPISGTVASTALTLTEGASTVATPANFIKDFKNGITIEAESLRLMRRDMNTIIGFKVDSNSRGTPKVYCAIADSAVIHIRPVPVKTYAALLWFYQMPAMPTSAQVPKFPADHMLVEYVRLRGKEWIHQLDPGTALRYLMVKIAEYQKAGLGSEAEADQIEIDRHYFPGDPGSGQTREDWMGLAIVQ